MNWTNQLSIPQHIGRSINFSHKQSSIGYISWCNNCVFLFETRTFTRSVSFHSSELPPTLHRFAIDTPTLQSLCDWIECRIIFSHTIFHLQKNNKFHQELFLCPALIVRRLSDLLDSEESISLYEISAIIFQHRHRPHTGFIPLGAVSQSGWHIYKAIRHRMAKHTDRTGVRLKIPSKMMLIAMLGGEYEI